MKSFQEIGDELGISKQRAKQLYDIAMEKIMNELTEEEREDLMSVLHDLDSDNNLHDSVTDAMFNASLGKQTLKGFWKE